MSHRSASLIASVALVLAASLAAGCAGVQDRVGDLRGTAESLSDQVRFCLALTRTVTAIESGSPATAAEAAEEALAQAPAELRREADAVVSALRDAGAGRPEALQDAEVVAAAQRLRDRGQELCDPRN